MKGVQHLFYRGICAPISGLRRVDFVGIEHRRNPVALVFVPEVLFGRRPFVCQDRHQRATGSQDRLQLGVIGHTVFILVEQIRHHTRHMQQFCLGKHRLGHDMKALEYVYRLGEPSESGLIRERIVLHRQAHVVLRGTTEPHG